MLYNWELSERLSCTHEEMHECYKTVKKIVNLSEKGRKQGLLSLEEDIDTLASPFFRKGLRLVVDGTDPALIKHILEIQLFIRGYKGKELLENCIIYEGVLAIQEGDNPRIVEEILHSFFPEEFQMERAGQVEDNYRKTIEQLSRNVSHADFSKWEELILSLEDRAVQRILREVDSYGLCIALSHCADPVKYKIFKNISASAGILLLEDIEFIGSVSKEAGKEEQEKLLHIIQKLEDQGDIVVRRTFI